MGLIIRLATSLLKVSVSDVLSNQILIPFDYELSSLLF